MPKFHANFDYIPIPRKFIESHMPSANGAYVKVYLYALSLAYEGVEMSTAEIARVLNLLESDVVNALEYWSKDGALVLSGDNILFSGGSSTKTTAPPKKEPPKQQHRDITETITENKALADLCAIAQEILERPLKTRDMETLYWFYDELELSPEVITMLLEYCASKGKRNMNYIEKIAISWHENGIITLAAADKFITAEKATDGYLKSIKKLFGFGDRNLSKSEETYLKFWHDECGMDENMVGLAYEYCLDAIHTLSFPYMDTIIKRWKELGILTIEAAEKDHEEFKNKKNLSVFDDKNSAYDELEQIMREKM